MLAMVTPIVLHMNSILITRITIRQLCHVTPSLSGIVDAHLSILPSFYYLVAANQCVIPSSSACREWHNTVFMLNLPLLRCNERATIVYERIWHCRIPVSSVNDRDELLIIRRLSLVIRSASVYTNKLIGKADFCIVSASPENIESHISCGFLKRLRLQERDESFVVLFGFYSAF